MTVYEIINEKEQEVERLTREIAALRTAARMLEESQSVELELVPTGDRRAEERKSDQKTLRQFP